MGNEASKGCCERVDIDYGVRDGGDGSSRSDPLNKVSKPERIEVSPQQWFSNVLNVAQWCLLALWGQYMLFIPTFMGDFEAWFWYVRELNGLLPDRLAYESNLYVNRQNGLIIGTQMYDFEPAPSNWTTFEV